MKQSSAMDGFVQRVEKMYVWETQMEVTIINLVYKYRNQTSQEGTLYQNTPGPEVVKDQSFCILLLCFGQYLVFLVFEA